MHMPPVKQVIYIYICFGAAAHAAEFSFCYMHVVSGSGPRGEQRRERGGGDFRHVSVQAGMKVDAPYGCYVH